MPGHSKSRTRAEKGSKTLNEIHLAVGRALSDWLAVEVAYGRIFDLCISENRYVRKYHSGQAAANDAYWTLNEFGVRIQLAKSAAHKNFADAHAAYALKGRPHDPFVPYLTAAEATFEKLLTDTATLTPRFMELCRGIAVFQKGQGAYLEPMPRDHELREPNREGGGLAYRYNAADIDHYAKSFASLAARLNKFVGYIEEVRESVRMVENRK